MEMNTKDLLYKQVIAHSEDASAKRRIVTDYLQAAMDHLALAEVMFVMIGSTPRMDNTLTTPLHKTSGIMPNGFRFANRAVINKPTLATGNAKMQCAKPDITRQLQTL